MNAPKCLLPLTFSVLGVLFGPSQGLAAQILGSADPYAVLGATLSRKQCCATSEARRPSRRWSGVNLVHTGAAR
jgi:hypothetical protein